MHTAQLLAGYLTYLIGSKFGIPQRELLNTVYKGLHEKPLNSGELERLSEFGYQPSSAMFGSAEAALDYLKCKKKYCEQRNMPEWLRVLPDWLYDRYKH
jgi:hypothetical protein